MLNERIDSLDFALRDAIQVRFDLSDAELLAAAGAAAGVIEERFRGVALDGEAVSELRELVAVHDSAVERAHDGYDGETLVMSVARIGLLVRALGDWQARCERIGFLRPGDAASTAIVDDLLVQLRDLYGRAARAALGAAEPAYSAA